MKCSTKTKEVQPRCGIKTRCGERTQVADPITRVQKIFDFLETSSLDPKWCETQSAFGPGTQKPLEKVSIFSLGLGKFDFRKIFRVPGTKPKRLEHARNTKCDWSQDLQTARKNFDFFAGTQQIRLIFLRNLEDDFN